VRRANSHQKSWSTSSPALQLSIAPEGGRRDTLEASLRDAIRDGRLPAGARLPSTRAFAADLGLARGTVAEAYAQLQAEGYLTARRGGGTWVSEVAASALPRRPRAVAAPRAARFSFHPGLPDLAAFPHAAWSSALRRGLREAPAASLGYGDPRGRPELREALADYLARVRGVVANPELIVVCGGFRHGLSLVARVLRARRARRVAMEEPGLDDHHNVLMTAGLEPLPLPVDEHGARTDLLGESGAAAAVIGPAHQFPSGALLHPERRAAALAWARASGGLVIEDDYDAELRFDRQPIGALQALDPERVVYGGTASKTLAPGLRLGWLVLPAELLKSVLALREAEDLHVPAPDQIAFAELLGSGTYERHVRRMRARYRGRRERVVALLAESAPEIKPVGISAGLRVLLELPAGGPSGAELAERAAGRSIELFPVGRFHHHGEPVPDGVVLGYGALPEHAFEAGLRALGELFAEALSAESLTRPSKG
jgi:GntR family transcriptional regulator / MocR family aminotransferase